MSSLIQQAQTPALTAATAAQRSGAVERTEGSEATTSADAAAAAEEAAAVSIDATPSTPPPEVLAQVRRAEENYAALQAQGYEVHFSVDPESRASTAELRDAQGVVVRRLTPSEAIDLAIGQAPASEEG